jgi:hypothetical protein
LALTVLAIKKFLKRRFPRDINRLCYNSVNLKGVAPMALVPCRACGKEVEETSTCLFCGTLIPKKVMLSPCRVCGEKIGKTARKCPYCKNQWPNKEKYIRSYFSLFYIAVLIYTAFNYSELLNKLGSVYLTVLALIGLWFYSKNLKDSAE